MLVDLDRYELFSLLESAAHGGNLRQDIWSKFVDKLFQQMDPYIIRFLRLQCIEKLSDFYSTDESVGLEDFQKFLARYDIDNNLYEISCCKSGKHHIVYGFLFDEKFYVSMNRFVNPELITGYEKVDTSDMDDIDIHNLIWEGYWDSTYDMEIRKLLQSK